MPTVPSTRSSARARAAARPNGALMTLLVFVLLAGLPLAVWLDLRNLTEQALRRQASDLNSVITSMRNYYATNVVARVLANHGGPTQVTHTPCAAPSTWKDRSSRAGSQSTDL